MEFVLTTAIDFARSTWAAAGPSTVNLPRVRQTTQAQRDNAQKQNITYIDKAKRRKARGTVGPGKSIRLPGSFPPLRESCYFVDCGDRDRAKL